MTKRLPQLYEARAKIAKALAHPSRLFILDALNKKEMCVYDLTKLVGVDQSTVSKHLSILKDVGLITDSKKGSMRYYRINCRCLQDFFNCIESVLKQNVKAQQKLLSR